MYLVDTTSDTSNSYMSTQGDVYIHNTHTFGPVTTYLHVFAVHKGSTGLLNKPGIVYQMRVST